MILYIYWPSPQLFSVWNSLSFWMDENFKVAMEKAHFSGFSVELYWITRTKQYCQYKERGVVKVAGLLIFVTLIITANPSVHTVRFTFSHRYNSKVGWAQLWGFTRIHQNELSNLTVKLVESFLLHLLDHLAHIVVSLQNPQKKTFSNEMNFRGEKDLNIYQRL